MRITIGLLFPKVDVCRCIGIILAALLVGAMNLACNNKDDVEQIRSIIKSAAALAESHDISGLLDLTSEDVKAMPMNLGRNGIRGILWRAFKYYGQISVLYPRPKIEVQQDRDIASARFPFLIVKTEQPIPNLEKLRNDPKAWVDAIGETADLYRLQLELFRQDSLWRVSHVVLEHFTGFGFN